MKKALRRASTELNAGNPLWKIIVLKNNWLCPFCGEIGAEGLRMEDVLEERIAFHLSTCEAFADGAGAPLDRAALEKRSALIAMRARLQRSLADQAFRVTDHEGCWVCAYCARATSIVLDAAAAEEGAEPDERTIAKMLRHLLECADYAQGKGKPRLLAEIMQAATATDWKKRARRIRGKLETEPAWRFRDMDKRWLCPFCAGSTEIPFDRDGPLDDKTCEAVLDHLDACNAWSQLEGKPRTERFLKDRVIAINRARVLEKLRRKLGTHAIWQVTDADDAWYCPYCAKPTGILLPDSQKADISEGALNEVWTHLSSCAAYAGKRAQLKSRSFLRNVVASVDRQIRLRREVRRAISEDPRWTVHDAAGSWLCPHCKKVQKAISVSRESSLLEKTLEQVITHLLEQCPHYAEGAEPEGSFADLKGELEDRRRKSHSSESEEWIQRIDQEVAALKTKVEVSVELERSLEDARSRQLRLLPRVPEVPGLEFGIVYKPCSTVGGDFYDFVRVGEDQLGIAIGDISGHGIEAALLVGLAKKLLEIHGRARTSPAETLLLANADIYPDLDAKTFVTVWYGLLNTRTRELRFARAGHNPLVLYNPRRTPRLEVLDSKGMALGMDAGGVFQQSLEEVSIKLERGDILFQYTDGVTESMNHDRDEFGLERLYAVIEQFGTAEAEYLLYQVEKALSDFREGAKQKDDITMLAIRVL